MSLKEKLSKILTLGVTVGTLAACSSSPITDNPYYIPSLDQASTANPENPNKFTKEDYIEALGRALESLNVDPNILQFHPLGEEQLSDGVGEILKAMGVYSDYDGEGFSRYPDGENVGYFILKDFGSNEDFTELMKSEIDPFTQSTKEEENGITPIDIRVIGPDGTSGFSYNGSRNDS